MEEEIVVKYLSMDGEIHYSEDPSRCCGSFGRTCSSCGGHIHFQPVYAGIYESCDSCDPAWSPELPEEDASV